MFTRQVISYLTSWISSDQTVGQQNGATPYRVCTYSIIVGKPCLHVNSLHAISQRLVDASTVVPAPPPASARISHSPFASLLKDQWNQQTAAVYGKLREWDDEAQEWGRKVLYGQQTRKDES